MAVIKEAFEEATETLSDAIDTIDDLEMDNVWKAEDDEELRQMWAKGKSVQEIADHFGRKKSSIITRMKKLGL